VHMMSPSIDGRCSSALLFKFWSTANERAPSPKLAPLTRNPTLFGCVDCFELPFYTHHPQTNMADAKPDPAADQAAAPSATLQQDETAKVTTDVTGSKPAEGTTGSSVTDTVASAASTATAAVKDNVFSMFGGGPKKERKETEDVDEPSGASKPKDEVSTTRDGGWSLMEAKKSQKKMPDPVMKRPLCPFTFLFSSLKLL